MLIGMKKATLYALKEDRDAILLSLQKSGSIMLIPENEKVSLPGIEDVGTQIDKTKDALKFIDIHGKKSSLLEPRPNISYDAFLEE